MKETALKTWVYFKHGHTAGLAYFVSLLNFVTLQYSLLVSRIDLLELLFPTLFAFFISFIVIYPPVAIVVGWLDYKWLTMPTIPKVNPYAQDSIKAWILHFEGKDEEAIAILKKWVNQT